MKKDLFPAKRLLLSMFFVIFSLFSFTRTFYLPHIHTGSDAWETYLIIENPVYGGALYKLTLYDENGNIVSTQIDKIPTGKQVVIPLRNLGGVSGIFETNEESINVRVGYIAKDDLGGGTAEFQLPSSLTSQAIFSLSNYYDKLTWSGFALFNGSDKTVHVTATGYKNGEEIVSKGFNMDPKTKIVDYFDSFFNLNSFTDIDTVVFQSMFPALTGIVISGKENDKLLFSPCRNTEFNQIINITRHYEGYVHQTNFVSNREDYFAVIHHGGKNYLKRIFGNTENGFDEIELGGNIYCKSLVNSSNNDSLIILGTDNSNHFIARKIDTSGNTIWEATLGICASGPFFDPDLLNIVGGATNGTLIVAFHDYNLNQGQIKAINESDGSIINTINFTSTGRFYKSFVSGNNVGIACTYSSNNKYYLQFMFLDSTGAMVKHIYGQSPITPDNENIIYDAFQNGDNIFCCFGTEINDGSNTNYWYYSTFIMIIPYSNSDLSNPSMLIPLNLFLRKGSIAFSLITPEFENGYDFAWILYTSPYYTASTSTSFIINIKNNDGGGYSASIVTRDLPYHILSAYGEDAYFIISSYQYKTFGYDTSFSTVVDKELFAYKMLDY